VRQIFKYGSCGYDMEDAGCRWMVSKACLGCNDCYLSGLYLSNGLFEKAG
jgi:hypothetical protein